MLGESQSGCLICARVSVSEASFLSSESSAVVFFHLSFLFERDRNKHVPQRGLPGTSLEVSLSPPAAEC